MATTQPDDPKPAASRAGAPRQAAPVWEVEMLVSGAALFSMVRVPGWLREHLIPLESRFVDEIGSAFVIAHVYLAGAAVTLALTFGLHLLLRARWIALVGMRSVFPHGVRWDKLKLSPLARKALRIEDDDAVSSIDRADDRATIMFALGVDAAMIGLAFGVLLLLVLAVVIGISMFSGWHASVFGLFIGIAGVFVLPLVLASLADHLFGERAPAGGRVQRTILGTYAVYRRLGVLNKYSTMRLLESNKGATVAGGMVGGLMIASMLIVAANLLTWLLPQAAGNFAMFPDFDQQSVHRLRAAHYADQRDPLRTPATPFIESLVVDGPYLRLMLPYAAESDEAAMRSSCAFAGDSGEAADGASTEQRHEARATTALACLAALHLVALDGAPLASLQYHVTVDPDTGIPSLLTMIDVRELAPGHHWLRVGRVPEPDASAEEVRELQPWTIHFWR